MSEICYYCGNTAIHQFKSNKRWCCSISANHCPAKREKDSLSKKGKNPWEGREHPRGMLGKTNWMKGLSYHEIHGEDAERLLEILRNNDNTGNWAKVPQRRKEELAEAARERIIARYETGWMPKAGRCRKYHHDSPIAGNVVLDGTWELQVAEWLDEQKLNWRRNTKRFPYTHLNGRLSHYTPDFWVEDWNTYLEVKGYETDLDRCKWSQFNEPLLVWKKTDIEALKDRYPRG